MSLTLVSCDQALSLRVSAGLTAAAPQLGDTQVNWSPIGALFDPPQTANLAPWCQGHQAEVDFSC